MNNLLEGRLKNHLEIKPLYRSMRVVKMSLCCLLRIEKMSSQMRHPTL